MLQRRWSQIKHRHHVPEIHGRCFTWLQVTVSLHRLEAPQFLHPHHCRQVFRLFSVSCYYQSGPLEPLCTPVSLSRPPGAPGPQGGQPSTPTQQAAGRGQPPAPHKLPALLRLLAKDSEASAPEESCAMTGMPHACTV